MISLCLSSVVRRPRFVNFCFKRLLFQNGQTDFKIILHEGSLGDPLLQLLKPFRFVEQGAARAKNRKSFKRLLFLNQEMNLEIIVQEHFWVTLYQNCSNGFATSNKMDARAISRYKPFTTSSAKSVNKF